MTEACRPEEAGPSSRVQSLHEGNSWPAGVFVNWALGERGGRRYNGGFATILNERKTWKPPI